MNIVAVEASVMSLVCWNLKVFLQCGLSAGKRPTNLLVVCWGLYSAMIRQGYKKEEKNKQTNKNKTKQKQKQNKKNLCLPSKSGPLILNCLQPQLVLFSGLIPQHTFCFTKHMSKNCKQNTFEKKVQANLLKKKFQWRIFVRLSAIIYKSV